LDIADIVAAIFQSTPQAKCATIEEVVFFDEEVKRKTEEYILRHYE
jgi:1-deoxy-D-xylulose 5-phosphate reductoisomerase